jgi:hypothetical protein
MIMKKNRLFAMFTVLLMATSVFGRDIHGVNGFYNWSPSQMKSAKLITISSGTTFAKWASKLNYGDNYTEIQLGVNNATNNGGFPWRTTVRLTDTGAGIMTLTKDYPVVAFKFSMANNNLTKGQSNDDINMFVEHWWYNPTTGVRGLQTNAIGFGLSGLASNGRYSYVYQYPYKICNNPNNLNFGRDSVRLGGLNALTEHKKTANGVLWASRQANTGTIVTSDTSMVFMRLPSSSNERAEYVVLLNYYSIADTNTVLAKASKRLLDRQNIKLSDIYINFFARRDTMQFDTTFTTEGAVQKIDTVGIPQSKIPSTVIKWVKTFKSINDAWSAMNTENAWGDGIESAQKSALNYGLYYAEQILGGYCWRNSNPYAPDDAAYVAYKAAYDNANTVYGNAVSTDVEFAAATQALQTAKETFMKAVDLKSTLIYSYLKSETGSGSIVAGADNVTIGTYTGKPLTFGSNDAAMAFSFTPTGNTVDGQKTYRMGTATAGVVQASTGALLLVPGQQGSIFSFGERDVEGKGYDLKCGDYYYYMDGNGTLASTTSFPVNKDNFDAVSPYFFNVKDALADYKAKVTESEKTDLFTAWEFNSTPVEDPGTHGFVTDSLSNPVEKYMTEYASTKMVDGWRMSRWRAYTRVNQENVALTNGTATCLVLSGASVYDNFDGSQAGLINDFSASPAMRYDFGKQTPFYVRDPSPRDSSHAINLNAGYTRYIAMKWLGTNSNIALLQMNYLLPSGLNGLNLTSANATGIKGNVMYWDMLQTGAVVGKQLYLSAFFSTVGFASVSDKMYIDWIRTYDSIDAIPNEDMKLANGVKNVTTREHVNVYVEGKTINVYSDHAVVYSLTGALVAKVSGAAHLTVASGVYLVKSGSAVEKVIVR